MNAYVIDIFPKGTEEQEAKLVRTIGSVTLNVFDLYKEEVADVTRTLSGMGHRPELEYLGSKAQVRFNLPKGSTLDFQVMSEILDPLAEVGLGYQIRDLKRII